MITAMVSVFNQPIPERIGKYKILGRIASGGMAEVFLAKSESAEGFEKLCAIKRILPHMATNDDFLKMLLDEARIAAQLSHGNIAQIFELARADNSYFIAMEYVLGVSVGEILKHLRMANALASPAMATYIMINICSALEYAHTKCGTNGRPLKIIHRDVSPSNVMISTEGDVKLIDFGIVKAVEKLHETRAGSIKGKFGYMSPEQLRAKKEVDHRSDIFSAGIMLFELLTNKNPFHDSNEAVSMERALQALVPNPSSLIIGIPRDLEQICLKAVANHPGDRFQSAGEMAQALDTFWREGPFSRLQMSSWIKSTFKNHLNETPWIPKANLKILTRVNSQASHTNDPPAVIPLVQRRPAENPTVQLSGAKRTTPLTESTVALGSAPTVQSQPGKMVAEVLELPATQDVDKPITSLVNENEIHQVLTEIKGGPSTINNSQLTTPLAHHGPPPPSATSQSEVWKIQTRTFIIHQLQLHPRLLVGIAGCFLLCFGLSIFWCIGDPPPMPVTPPSTIVGVDPHGQPDRSATDSEQSPSAETPPQELSPSAATPSTEGQQGAPDTPQENTEQIEALRAMDGTKPPSADPAVPAPDKPVTVKTRPRKKKSIRARKRSRAKRNRARRKKPRSKPKPPQIPFDGL